MNRSLFVPLATLGLTFALAVPALANDKFTGLPLVPGVGDHDPANLSAICNGSNHVRSSLFSWRAGTSPAAIADWYAKAISGSKTHHQVANGSDPITEYVVISGDGTSRVEVNVLRGNTIMRLAHAQRRIDWTQSPQQQHCESTE